MEKLNLPPVKLRIREDKVCIRVWDDIRGMWLVLTPEEWVRRHLIGYLTEHLHVTPQMISQEHPVALNGMSQRADVVVYDKSGKPLLLVECKCPDVTIDAGVYAQAVRYNTVLGAKYIMLTNGLKHYIYEKNDSGNYSVCEQFPEFK